MHGIGAANTRYGSASDSACNLDAEDQSYVEVSISDRKDKTEPHVIPPLGLHRPLLNRLAMDHASFQVPAWQFAANAGPDDAND
jgi:hypothetical protein